MIGRTRASSFATMCGVNHGVLIYAETVLQGVRKSKFLLQRREQASRGHGFERDSSFRDFLVLYHRCRFPISKEELYVID